MPALAIDQHCLEQGPRFDVRPTDTGHVELVVVLEGKKVVARFAPSEADAFGLGFIKAATVAQSLHPATLVSNQREAKRKVDA